jgi:hypothetical protein
MGQNAERRAGERGRMGRMEKAKKAGRVLAEASGLERLHGQMGPTKKGTTKEEEEKEEEEEERRSTKRKEEPRTRRVEARIPLSWFACLSVCVLLTDCACVWAVGTLHCSSVSPLQCAATP